MDFCAISQHELTADSLVELFKEITDLGQIEPIDGGQASDGIRRFKVTTTSSDSDLLDLFTAALPGAPE